METPAPAPATGHLRDSEIGLGVFQSHSKAHKAEKHCRSACAVNNAPGPAARGAACTWDRRAEGQEPPTPVGLESDAQGLHPARLRAGRDVDNLPDLVSESRACRWILTGGQQEVSSSHSEGAETAMGGGGGTGGCPQGRGARLHTRRRRSAVVQEPTQPGLGLRPGPPR